MTRHGESNMQILEIFVVKVKEKYKDFTFLNVF